MKLVMKFGGTSLGDGKRIRHVASLIKRYSEENELVVVASAMSNVTDELIRLTSIAESGREDEVDEILDRLSSQHEDAIGDAIKDEKISAEVWRYVQRDLDGLRKAVKGVCYIMEATPRTRDLILSFGERLSTRILWGAMLDFDLPAVYLTGKDAGIVTDSNFGEAMPLIETTYLNLSSRLGSLISEGKIPTVTGFIAADTYGVITTLGRGGSDYTATLIGSAINADEIWLWSDVDGLMTANPKIVPNARVLPEISYAEAIEMAMFGAKGLHPRAFEPTIEKGIPVRIRNTFNPDEPGTLITKSKIVADNIVKAVLLVENVGMLSIRGTSIVGRPGTAAKILDAIARRSINIMMISQSVSESSISLIIKRDLLEKAIAAIETSLLSSGIAKDIEVDEDVAVVAVIGEGMKGTPGIAARVFKAVASKGINVKMISQGASELNISFVVKGTEAVDAVRAVHDEFNLGA
ncbi:MAG: aspartate kinase [Thaumarchaeota archaeon]|nr:aspartate kinase [Candidatus Terraquivivens yellowstonensis]MCL7401135.1 aspartate kinase [Candidatus Terraquivivens yellowstonensis]